MIFERVGGIEVGRRDVVIDSDRSKSGIISRVQEGLVGLILCYAQVLSVVGVGSLFSKGYRVRVSHVSVNPSCRVSKWMKSGNKPKER